MQDSTRRRPFGSRGGRLARPVLYASLASLAFLSAAPASPRLLRDDPAPRVPDRSFVIRHVRLFDGERVIERTDVAVDGGRVTAIGDLRGPFAAPVIDGAGLTLLPGLIDSHAHVLGENALRNGLRFGVTTMLDMFTKVEVMQALRGARDRWNRTDEADLFSAGAPATSAGGMGTQFGIPFETIASPEEAPAFVRARLAEGSDYIKALYEPSAGIVTTISSETLAAVIAAAHAEGVLAVVHVSSLQGARAAVEAGADGLAHCFGDSLIDEALARRMAARGVFVTATLSLFAAIDGEGLGPALASDPRLAPYLTEGQRKSLTEAPPGADDPMGPYLARFRLRVALENVRRLHAAGVRILAGDDAPNLGTFGASLHGELKLLTAAGLSPLEALRAATSAPADAFRLPGRGRIAKGARADLVLVKGNPSRDIEATRAIVRVFKNGFDVPRAVSEPTAAGASD